MLRVIVYCCVLFVCSSCVRSDLNDDAAVGNLVLTQIIFRHGDRNPQMTYPTDPWKDMIHWPEGWGQLSKAGLRREYELGKFFRRRYGQLISENVYPNNLVYVRSTDFDRTLMSAQAVLAGLFPPMNDQIWNENIMWQPIPIHTKPTAIDYDLLGDFDHVKDMPCSQYNHLLEENLQTEAYKMWRLKYKWLYSYIENKSGKSLQKPMDIVTLHDTLKIEQLSGKAIPDWAVDRFSDIEKLSHFEVNAHTGTRQMSRYRAGYLIKEIFQRFTNRTKGPFTPDRKIWLYSAHDSNIANVLNALDLARNNLPPYGASILFELYESNGAYYVQIFFRDDDNENPIPMHIPDCGIRCSLDNLYKIYESIIPTRHFLAECELEIEKEN